MYNGVVDGDVPASLRLNAVPVTAKLLMPTMPPIIRTICVIWPLVAVDGVNLCAGAHAAAGGAVHDTQEEHTSVAGVPT